jgi:glycosyltransferase involved in cell wall biosynthesis
MDCTVPTLARQWTMKPSILFVDQFSDISGSQRSLLNLLPALDDFQLDFALPGPGALTAALQRRGLTWQRLDVGDYSLGRKSLADIARFAARQRGVAATLTRMAAGKSLIYATGPRVFPAVSIAARRVGIPLIWHLHLEIESRRDRMILEAAAAWGRPRVIACSQACLKPFSEKSALRRRATVVYNGVEELRVPSQAHTSPVIGMIGRIHPDKGVMDLLDAVPEVLCAFPDARFRFVGPRVDAAFSRKVAERAAELTSQSGVECLEFPGEASSPAVALSGLDVVVVPSRRESASFVVMEAFCAGVPVIASDAGGLPEVVGRDGVVFPRGDSGKLAAVIIRVLLDPGLRQRMIHAGRRSFEERWSVDRYRQAIRSEIETQIALRPPTP